MLIWSLGLAWASGQAEKWQLTYPLRVRPTAAAEFGHLAASLPQVCPVLARRAGGVQVLAAAGVPAAKVLRVCNVLAQYLDTDADGLADDPRVAQAMDATGAMMVMWENQTALDDWGWSPRNWLTSFFLAGQDVEGDETAATPARAVLAEGVGPGQNFSCGCGAGICDHALEEAFHLVYDAGLSVVYPELSARSSLLHAVLGSLGETRAEGGVRKLIAAGAFDYEDPSCWWDCQVSEAVFHIVASLNGQHAKECCLEPDEWSICVSGDAVGTARNARERAPELVEELSARMPGVGRMPDGDYRPREPAQRARSLQEQPQRLRAPVARLRLGGAPALLRQLRRGPHRVRAAVFPGGEVEARHVR